MKSIMQAFRSWDAHHPIDLEHAPRPDETDFTGWVEDPVCNLVSDLKSRKAAREEQDGACVGGLRNPNYAVSKNPSSARWGRRFVASWMRSLTTQ